MDTILQVKNLQVSFKTNNGTVKAVRDISFDLERGRTLAIVGESGSGKSVTSKAIMGILAGNSIVDNGEILYDGRDLLKISEEEMNKLRGDKISMIFQDPLSSLNPIIKIGKQITEAMLLKNSSTRKNARKEFNTLLEDLRVAIIEATDSSKENVEKINEICKTFDKFCVSSLDLENYFNQSISVVEDALSNLEDFIFRAEKKQTSSYASVLSLQLKYIERIKDQFILQKYSESLKETTLLLKEEIKNNTSNVFVTKLNKFLKKKVESTPLTDEQFTLLYNLKKLYKEILQINKPNFFCIGYYKLNTTENIFLEDIEELNKKARKFLDKNFMNNFLSLIDKAVELSHKKSLENKKLAIESLKELKNFFINSEDFSKKDAKAEITKTSKVVASALDPLDIYKDAVAITFKESMNTAIKSYLYHKVNNVKEEKRFEKQNARYEALLTKGKNVDWKVIPKKVIPLNEIQNNIISLIDRLINDFSNQLNETEFDVMKKSVSLIDYFKEKASIVVYKITKNMAKEKAIKLMEEVGIPEPRLRYTQYPFQFSGGMRQRIVIAIALAADPDILICDEPTTALDVTIQAQILELINQLKVERNLSIIFITHDLGVVANMADDIAVMYAGKIVEYGTVNDIFYSPAHPYTWALLSSMPDLETNEKLEAIPGTPPNMIYPPKGDAFADRNKYALKIDFEQQPPMFEISETHRAATWLLHPNAPKVEIPKIITERIKRMKTADGGVSNEQ